MQNITLYALASSTLGVIKDYANSMMMPAPTFTLGFSALLKLRLFSEDDSDTPYPLDLLSPISSWSCIWDTDYDDTSVPKLEADSSQIRVATVKDTINGTERTYTEVSIPIPNMNTEELKKALGKAESIGNLNMELIGYDGTGEVAFGLQVKGFTVRNRIKPSGKPTPIVPDYLTKAQVEALIASGIEIDFSIDGSQWHTVQAPEDKYMRFRSKSSESAQWSENVIIPHGRDGVDGKNGKDGTNGTNGTDGTDGKSSYVYIAYANDEYGTGFTLIPNQNATYISFKVSDVEIPSPSAGDFSVWVKYVGDSGSGSESEITGVDESTITRDSAGVISVKSIDITQVIDLENRLGYLSVFEDSKMNIPAGEANTDYLIVSDGGSGSHWVAPNISLFTNDSGYQTESQVTAKLPVNPVVGETAGIKIWTGTQSEYDGIQSKNSSTLYFIKEGA